MTAATAARQLTPRPDGGRRCTAIRTRIHQEAPKQVEDPPEPFSAAPRENAPRRTRAKTTPAANAPMYCPDRRASDEQDENKQLSRTAYSSASRRKTGLRGGQPQRQTRRTRRESGTRESKPASRRLGRLGRGRERQSRDHRARTATWRPTARAAHAGIHAGRKCGSASRRPGAAPQSLARRVGRGKHPVSAPSVSRREAGPSVQAAGPQGAPQARQQSFSGSSGVSSLRSERCRTSDKPHAVRRSLHGASWLSVSTRQACRRSPERERVAPLWRPAAFDLRPAV